MIAKPDLSRYHKCPGCGTWQVKLTPCVKCGTCTYIEPNEEKKVIIPHDQYVQETITRENSVYVRRILELIKDGEWYPNPRSFGPSEPTPNQRKGLKRSGMSYRNTLM